MKNIIKQNKVMFVGDIHLMDRQPKNRLDDYSLSIRTKLIECFQIAEERKLDAVVLLGDLFEVYEVGPLLRNQTLEILKGLPNGNKPWSFPIYICVGNHDLDSSSNLEKTALGTLISAGLLIKKDYEPSLGLSFAHYTPSLDREIKQGFLTTSSAIIWVCHASISTKLDRFAEYAYLFEDTPLHPNTNLVISGHIHHEMTQTRSDGKRFINPGSISRYSASRDNLEKDIKILILDYTLDGEIQNEEYIKLKSAKPASEVFKLEEMQAAKELKKDTHEFKLKVANMRTTSWQFTNLDDKLSALRTKAENANISNEIIDLAINAVKTVNTKTIKGE
jgi:DNA repair exonuclease SbcCD nuclease subunit